MVASVVRLAPLHVVFRFSGLKHHNDNVLSFIQVLLPSYHCLSIDFVFCLFYLFFSNIPICCFPRFFVRLIFSFVS